MTGRGLFKRSSYDLSGDHISVMTSATIFLNQQVLHFHEQRLRPPALPWAAPLRLRWLGPAEVRHLEAVRWRNCCSGTGRSSSGRRHGSPTYFQFSAPGTCGWSAFSFRRLGQKPDSISPSAKKVGHEPRATPLWPPGTSAHKLHAPAVTNTLGHRWYL